MRIGFAGYLNKDVGASGYYVSESLKQMGHEIYEFDYRASLDTGKYPTLAAMNTAFFNEFQNAPIDVLLVFKGELLHPKIVRAVADHAQIPTILWYPDELYMYDWEITMMQNYDHVFIIQETALKGLKLHGINAHYLIEGCFPDLHRPLEPTAADIEKYGADIMFAGSPYHRNYWLLEVLYHCLKKNLKFRLWGNGWWDSILDGVWGKRAIYNLEHSMAVSASKICLELSSPIMKVGSRIFQELAMGGLLITENLNCLTEWGLKSGEHYIGYYPDDHEGLLSLIDLVMQDPEGYRHIRENARKFAHEKNTYIDRLQQMFKEIGLK